MVAPSYSNHRSELARELGLGRKAGTKRLRRLVLQSEAQAERANARMMSAA